MAIQIGRTSFPSIYESRLTLTRFVSQTHALIYAQYNGVGRLVIGGTGGSCLIPTMMLYRTGRAYVYNIYNTPHVQI